MIYNDKSCLGFHFNKPDDSPQLKFQQEVGFPDLVKHSYIFRKDVTALSTIVNQFNKKFPRKTDQPFPNSTGVRRASEEKGSQTLSDRRVHSPYIPITELPPSLPVGSIVPPAPPDKNILLLSNQVAPIPLPDGYANIYSSGSDNDPVF